MKKNPDPILKKSLFWCPECNVPLIGGVCGCKARGTEMPLLKPYDVRPGLEYDHKLISDLLIERFGCNILPKVILFNKTGGFDRNDLVIANGVRFGWLSFDPVTRNFTFEPSFESLQTLLPGITKGIIDVSGDIPSGKRIGGKKIKIAPEKSAGLTPGPVIIKAGRKYGVGILADDSVKIKQIGHVVPGDTDMPDPDWERVIYCNKKHLKNIERNAVRFIKAEVAYNIDRRPNVNVSFSGGKDSTAVLELAKRAGITDSYYVNTGMEFPQTVEFVAGCGITKVFHGDDFRKNLLEHGLPCKDDRWCCERLKLHPVSLWLDEDGPCITVQGNRWYESFARSNLPPAIENPYNRNQLNLSPIRNWRALEVFLYVWWRELPLNPLYDMGYERVGCWMCPAMLESEAERTRELLPDLYRRWDDYLFKWASENKLDPGYVRFGLWRWKELPPKMKEFVHNMGIKIR